MSAQPDQPLRRVRMSWEEFVQLPPKPKNEWVDGEVVIDVAPVAFRHGDAVVQLSLLLGPLFPDHFLVTEVGVHLPRNRVRAPDLMMVDARPETDWVSETPALVIEVLSRSTRSEDTIRKSGEYAEKGIGQYWVVDPELRAMDLWRNVDGAWELLLRLDDSRPSAQVELADAVVPLDLRQILRT